MDSQEHPLSLLDAIERQEFERLACLYRDAKTIILYCEEVDPTFKSNLQVIKELRDAFDHLMRLFVSKIASAPGNGNEDYGKNQLDKAIGHTYRAAFDALDGTVLSLRLKINEAVSGYHIDVIKEIIPDYWAIKETLNRLTDNITTNRAEKDIKIDYSGLFERYVADVEDLKNAYDKILKLGPTLDECQQAYKLKKKDDDTRRFKVSLTASIIAGIILATISFFAGNYFKSSKATVPQPIESKIDNSGPKK